MENPTLRQKRAKDGHPDAVINNHRGKRPFGRESAMARRNAAQSVQLPFRLTLSQMKTAFFGCVLILGAWAGASAQQAEKDANISTVVASGKVSDNRYENSFFKLAVDAPNATVEMNPVVNTTGQYARLVQVLSKKATWESTYSFSVTAEPLTNLAKYPNTQPGLYVRSIRHQLEREGLLTVREEFPISIGGEQFTGAILQVQEGNGRKHYRGIYTAFRRGYILSLDAEASSEVKLNEMVTRMVKFVK
jgi:hypothetical protein